MIEYNTLIYHDGPLCWTEKDGDKLTLVSWLDLDDEFNYYIVREVKQEEVDRALAKEIDFRTLLVGTSQAVLVRSEYYNGNHHMDCLVQTGLLRDMLPDEGVFL